MYAVIETGGKQYRVTEGDVVFLERLNGEPGDNVSFTKILACSNEVETDFGTPYLDDVSVETKILGHGKDKKIVIFKYKAKKGYRKKQGHRQPYTKVRVERIESGKLGVAEYVEAEKADETSKVVEADKVVKTPVAPVVAVDDVDTQDDVDELDVVDTQDDVDELDDAQADDSADDPADVQVDDEADD